MQNVTTTVLMTPTTNAEDNNTQSWFQRKRRAVFKIRSFSKVDKDGNGEIGLDEFREVFPGTEPAEIDMMFNEADENQDGILDRVEYFNFMSRRAYKFARFLILPQDAKATLKARRMSHADQYSCKPPPVFMLMITLLELSVFFYHMNQFATKGISVEKYSPPPENSRLIYHPEKRKEIWRYFTYMFVHSGYMHLVNNVGMQLVLGILLEMVHRWWRVLIIYFAGGLASSLTYSIVNPQMGLTGASGGVYALMFAHMSTVTLNWPNMRYPWLRVFLFIAYALYDCGMAIHYDYKHIQTTVIAHVGGGIAGFLVGIIVLRNLELEKWENYLWYASLVVVATLSLFAVGWNVFKTEYNFENKT